MIVTYSLNRSELKTLAKTYAKEKGHMFFPRGKKTFVKLIKLAKYYNTSIIIFEIDSHGKPVKRIIKYDKEKYFKDSER